MKNLALVEMLIHSCRLTIADAQRWFSEKLPEQVLLTTGNLSRLVTPDELVSDILTTADKDRIFAIIDVALRGIIEDYSLIWVNPIVGKYVSDISQTWNYSRGLGPFKPVGLMIPTTELPFLDRFVLGGFREASLKLTNLKNATPKSLLSEFNSRSEKHCRLKDD